MPNLFKCQCHESWRAGTLRSELGSQTVVGIGGLIRDSNSHRIMKYWKSNEVFPSVMHVEKVIHQKQGSFYSKLL